MDNDAQELILEAKAVKDLAYIQKSLFHYTLELEALEIKNIAENR